MRYDRGIQYVELENDYGDMNHVMGKSLGMSLGNERVAGWIGECLHA